ncbi:MAG TPA: hypothetical protein VF768_04055 [Holophagaceae bacterium]
MRRPASILIAAASAGVAGLCLLSACRPRPKVPGWVRTAPADSLVGFSGEARWVLLHHEVRDLLAREPLADRALDLFLQKAHINPQAETGRLTIHFVGRPDAAEPSPEQGLGHVLIQLDQFRDPKALIAAVTASFPQEGQIRLEGRDWPLYVIFDLDTPQAKAHIRAASDEQGQIWIGDLSALQRLASQETLAARPDALAAAEWINPQAPFQGYLQPEALLSGVRKAIPDSSSALRDLPKGLDALFWSVTPGQGPDAPYRFELALAGSPEGISQIAPWLQRLVAVVNAVQPPPGAPAPELMQERRRVGLRATLTNTQLKLIMEKLGQSSFLPGAIPSPKA